MKFALFQDFANSICLISTKKSKNGQDGRLHNFEFINSAVSCLESEIWNENLGDKHEISKARIINSLEDSISSHQTLKLKIGINETTYEINKTLEFIKKLPASTRIRLDANESLSLDQLLLWVEALHQNPVLEFMEQPLPGIRTMHLSN